MFAVICFGIVDGIANSFKDIPQFLSILFISLALILYILPSRITGLSSYVMLMLIMLCSSIGFTNFLIDNICTPTLRAVDCEGHHAMAMGWVKGFIFGPLLTLMVGFIYFKEIRKYESFDRTPAIICFIILILAAFKFNPLIKIDRAIDEISRPRIIYPDGC